MFPIPIYVITSIVNVLISSTNRRNQQKASIKNFEIQSSNLEKQLEQQKLLHREGYKQQILDQLRSYDLSNGWPLDHTPCSIAQMIDGRDGNIPLNLIVAPVSRGGIQKELEFIWTDISCFFATYFRINSERPVIMRRYKVDFPVNPFVDYTTIWNGLKSVPTLYIAPYSTEQDGVLGFAIAFWGVSSPAPAYRTFELNIRKHYIDEIRRETEIFEQNCNEGKLQKSDNPNLASNIDIFTKEKTLLNEGFDFTYLDQTLCIYKEIKSTKTVYCKLAEQIKSLITVILSFLVDIYFVLEYGTTPIFPSIIDNINNKYVFPDLIIREFVGSSSKTESVSSENFMRQLYECYCEIVAKNIEPIAGVKNILLFSKNILNAGIDYEKKLVERFFPLNIRMGEYSADQIVFLYKIAKIEGIEKTCYFSKLIQDGVKSLSDMYKLGIRYLKGEYVNRNILEAKKYFSACAASNYKVSLCEILEYCESIRMHNEEILQFGFDIALQGDGELSFKMGQYCLKKGKEDLAQVWFRRSDKLGDPNAKSVLLKIQNGKKKSNKGTVSYDDLVDFAYKCNKQKSEIVSCSVICEYDLETSKYKITQIGLNAKGKAVVDGENIIGRKVVGNSIDDKIKLLCSNTFPYMFEIPISKNKTKNFNKEPKKLTSAGVGTVSYDDLVDFAYECNKQKSEVVSCSVICEYDSETSKYKITQIGLNAKGKAVVDGEKTFGRKIIANSIDDKIKLLCSNTFPSMFEIPLLERNNRRK